MITCQLRQILPACRLLFFNLFQVANHLMQTLCALRHVTRQKVAQPRPVCSVHDRVLRCVATAQSMELGGSQSPLGHLGNGQHQPLCVLFKGCLWLSPFGLTLVGLPLLDIKCPA